MKNLGKLWKQNLARRDKMIGSTAVHTQVTRGPFRKLSISVPEAIMSRTNKVRTKYNHKTESWHSKEVTCDHFAVMPGKRRKDSKYRQQK